MVGTCKLARVQRLKAMRAREKMVPARTSRVREDRGNIPTPSRSPVFCTALQNKFLTPLY